MFGSLNSSSGPQEEERCTVNDQMEVFTALYGLIFILAVPGNVLSVWAFTRSARAKHGSSSVYLVNLLAADILLLLSLPFKMMKDFGALPWRLMVFHCQASAVTIYISLYASIAFIAFTIIDRYLEDCPSLRSMRLQDLTFSRLLSLLIWVMLLLIMAPNMALPIKHVQVSRYLSCKTLKSDLGLHWHTLTVFLCTALFLNASGAVLISSALALKRLLRRRKHPKLWPNARRLARNVTAIALGYIFSFVPYHVVRTPYTLAQTEVITDCSTQRKLFQGKEWTLLLSAVHMCFDPVLFYCLSEPFRQTVCEMFSCGGNRTERETEQRGTEERRMEERGMEERRMEERRMEERRMEATSDNVEEEEDVL